MSGIWVVLETREGSVSRMSWEAVAAALQLSAIVGLPISAAVIGAQTELLAAELAANPITQAVNKLIRIEHPLLGEYTADGFSLSMELFFATEKPSYILFPHSYQVRDYAPALAARMGQALIGDVIAIDDGPVFTRQLLQGRLNGHYRHSGDGPCFLSVQAGAFAAQTEQAQPASSATEVTLFTPTLTPEKIRTKPGTPFRAAAQSVDLSAAQRIVSVGRGIKDAEHIPLAQQLATALGAELAGSRPVCDQGWLPAERQVGSSGNTVAPKLYLALGISGAIQHLVGMKGSQCIVAINQDADAPIFEVADYGIVGDLFEVVPALIEALNAAKQL